MIEDNLGFVDGKIFFFKFRQKFDDSILLSHLLDHVQEVEQLLDPDAEVVILELRHHRRDVVGAERVRLLQDRLERKSNKLKQFERNEII